MIIVLVVQHQQPKTLSIWQTHTHTPKHTSYSKFPISSGHYVNFKVTNKNSSAIFLLVFDHLGVAQISRARITQVLVLGSICHAVMLVTRVQAAAICQKPNNRCVDTTSCLLRNGETFTAASSPSAGREAHKAHAPAAAVGVLLHLCLSYQLGAGKLFLAPFVRKLATPLQRNPLLRGRRTIFHKRWQKDPPVWVWLKMKQGRLLRFWSMFPLTRVPIWYRF